MTAKEKALELCQKFGWLGFKWEQTNFTTISLENSKQCAILAVDEVLKQFDGLHKPEYCAFDAIGDRKFHFDGEYNTHMTGYDMIAYWEEVKSEIKNL